MATWYYMHLWCIYWKQLASSLQVVESHHSVLLPGYTGGVKGCLPVLWSVIWNLLCYMYMNLLVKYIFVHLIHVMLMEASVTKFGWFFGKTNSNLTFRWRPRKKLDPFWPIFYTVCRKSWKALIWPKMTKWEPSKPNNPHPPLFCWLGPYRSPLAH